MNGNTKNMRIKLLRGKRRVSICRNRKRMTRHARHKVSKSLTNGLRRRTNSERSKSSSRRRLRKNLFKTLIGSLKSHRSGLINTIKKCAKKDNWCLKNNSRKRRRTWRRRRGVDRNRSKASRLGSCAKTCKRWKKSKSVTLSALFRWTQNRQVMGLHRGNSREVSMAGLSDDLNQQSSRGRTCLAQCSMVHINHRDKTRQLLRTTANKVRSPHRNQS